MVPPYASAPQTLRWASSWPRTTARQPCPHDKIEEMDRQALRRAGFKDRDIWDIAAVAAFYNMSNRLAAAADMKPNREYHYMGREMVREEDGAPSAAGAPV